MATAITLSIFALALLLFLLERPRYDLVAMAVLVALALSGVLSSEEAFAGFANPSVVAILALFVLGRAVVKTGLAALFGLGLLRLAGGREAWIMALVVVAAGIVSAFLFNAAVVAALLPVVVAAAREHGIPTSRLLIPLSFGTLVGGTITLAGSTTNLGIQAALRSPSLAQAYPNAAALDLFTAAPIGACALAVTAFFFGAVGRWLLPSRRSEGNLAEQYRVRRFLTEVRVEPGSNLAGRTLGESGLGARENVTVLAIYRSGEPQRSPGSATRIEAGDILLVQAEPRDILRLRNERNLSLHEEAAAGESVFRDQDNRIVEAIVAPGCRYAGRTLREIGFRTELGLNVLALWRHGEVYPLALKEMPLRVGDALLLQGVAGDLERLRRSGDFLLTEELATPPRPGAAARLTAAVFAAALAAAGFGWAELPLSLLAAACLLVLLRVLHLKEAYEAVDWTMVVLVAGMLALASAFVKTRLDQDLAAFLARLAPQQLPGRLLLALLFLGTAAVSQLTRNAAAGILLVPFAMAIASRTGGNPQAFLMPVLVAASCPFLTPYGHQANSMVMGPGGYRYGDFTKVGLPLLVLLGSLTTVLVPVIYT